MYSSSTGLEHSLEVRISQSLVSSFSDFITWNVYIYHF